MHDAQPNHESLDRYRSFLTLLARAHLRPEYRGRLDPSDLVQQTLLEAHRDRSQCQGDGPAARAAWLRRILAHNLANGIRDLHREKRDVGRELSLDAVGAEADRGVRLASRLARDDATPMSLLVQQERLFEVAEQVESLPADQREAIVLRYWQGLSLDEIADHMDRTSSSVAGLLHRGLRKLRGVLLNTESIWSDDT